MKAKLKTVNAAGKRIIAVSDIHGNLRVFRRLLDKVKFSGNDVLIIVGDFLEKGEDSLGTLRFIMELCEAGNTHALLGNCDDLWMWVKSGEHDEQTLDFMLSQPNLIKEMCALLSIPMSAEMDIAAMVPRLHAAFGRELGWLENLPHIISAGDYVFAHSALEPGPLESQELEKISYCHAFMERGLSFDRYVIVGHWPTCLYRNDKPDCNPIIDRERKIISIDGGNVIKSFGQINALIIENDGFSSESADGLPVIPSPADQEASENPVFVRWPDAAVEIVGGEGEFRLIRHISYGRELYAPAGYIYETDDGFSVRDVSDYRLPVHKGEPVSLVADFSDRILAKKNGVVGWIMKT